MTKHHLYFCNDSIKFIAKCILIINFDSNLYRFFTYRAEKAHFYMIDFCYFVNLSAILQTLFCGCEGSFCGNWFQMNYILTQGPIATAIVLWGNSLVFHSLDKVRIHQNVFLNRVFILFFNFLIYFLKMIILKNSF